MIIDEWENITSWMIDDWHDDGHDDWHDNWPDVWHDDEWMFIECTLKCWNKWINDIVLNVFTEIKLLSIHWRQRLQIVSVRH